MPALSDRTLGMDRAIPRHDDPAYPPSGTGLRGQGDAEMEIGHAVRDGVFIPEPTDGETETYDLVVVGAGISGLAAAHFYLRAHPNARVLILDAHTDFGGHARRNEFAVDGHTLVTHGGTVFLDTPSSWSAEARRLVVEDLGIDLRRVRDSVEEGAYGLREADFFDAERWGEDRLVPREAGEPWPDRVARLPMPERARHDLVRLHTGTEDPLPGLTDAQRKEYLAAVSYERYLQADLGLGADAYDYVRRATNPLFGVDADRVPAADAWAVGCPGFGALRLTGEPWPGASLTALMALAETEDDGFIYFPDGNASVARLLLARLVPEALPGDPDMSGVVTARARYDRLDRPGGQVRVRLGATVYDVSHDGTPGTDGAPGNAREVAIRYRTAHGDREVRAGHVIMACWTSVTSHVLRGLPAEQAEAMRYGVKVPLVYARAAVRDWTAFANAGVSRVDTPTMYWDGFRLPPPTRLGDYASARDPELPTVVHLAKTPNAPGLPLKEQYRAGREHLQAVTFATLERELRDTMARALGPYGFDPARDIAAITVNRWAHGYAYEYTSLDDAAVLSLPPEERPHVKARRPFGRVAIAGSDAAAFAYTHAAIDEAHRAVTDLP